MNKISVFKNFMGLCKKPPALHLAACAANNYFEETSFLIISLREMIKNDVSSKFFFAAESG